MTNNSRTVDLSIIVVSYNVRNLLEMCLGSVSGCVADGLRVETWVVDNASADGSAEMVRQKFPDVRLIENKENRGFAAANNQGLAQAMGRYAMLLNPDTTVKDSAVEMLVQFMDAHPNAGACGGKLLYPDGSLQHSAFEFPTLAQVLLDFFQPNWRFTESRINGRYPRSWYARGKPFQVDHPLGADFLVRIDAAKQVGWLDERFFLNCEEIDWAIRLKRAGWEIWCVPEAEIIHYEAQSKSQFRDESFINLWRARFRLFEKHYSIVFRQMVRWIVWVGLWKLAREARSEARLGLVTQVELDQRLKAFRAVKDMASAQATIPG